MIFLYVQVTLLKELKFLNKTLTQIEKIIDNKKDETNSSRLNDNKLFNKL